jgi:hypothetical protein
MSHLPIWILRNLAVFMIAADVAVLTAASRFSQARSLEWFAIILLLAVLTAIPYVGVLLLMLVVAPKHSVTQWVLLVGMVPVAAASFLCKLAEYGTAHEAWLARVNGSHFMNCGPPARLAILFLDYCGIGAAVGIAAIVLLIQHLIGALNTPSPPSPPPSLARNTPR